MGLDVGDGDLAPVEPPHHGDQRGQVVDVLEALADRLEHDRERRVLGGHLEQLGRALALLPQRGAAAGVAAGQQQGPGGALAEAGGEERGPADLRGDELLDLVGLEHHDLAGGRLDVGVGDADDDAVVGGHGLAVDAVALAQPGVDRQRPRRVHGGAVGGVHDQPPVAQLVAEPLDQEGAVAGQQPGGLDLLVDVADQVAGGPLVEPGFAGAGGGRLGGQPAELAGEGPDGLAELGRPAEGVALPERQPAGHAGSGGDQHPVVGDVLDPPAGGAQREHVADPRLVDHLLVELADPAAGTGAADQEHAEQAAVGDGAAAGDRQPLGAGPAGDRAGDAVPDDARAQLGELVGRVATAEQVERGVVRAARQLGERRAAAYEVVELVDRPGVEGGRGHDLLGEHVERVGRDPQRLDGAGAHPFDGHGGLGQVAAVLGEQHAAGDLADLVAGAADALEGAGHAGRRLDLDDQVDRAHVDAELEAAGGDHAGQSAALEVVLDEGSLLLGHRPVVRLGDDRPRRRADAPDWAITWAGGRSDSGRSPPARLVAISLSRAVSRSASRRELAKTIVERCCSIRSATCSSTCGQIEPVRPSSASSPSVSSPSGAVMSSTGTTTLRSHVFSEGGATISTGGMAAEEARHLVERTHGGGQADALGGLLEEGVEPFEAHREVGAALAAGHGVHLVDDHRLDAAQRLAGLRGEHQEQRLRGGDEHVGRPGRQRAALGRGGVAGADADPQVGQAGGPSPPSRSAAWRMPASGARRLRSTSTASALSGET